MLGAWVISNILDCEVTPTSGEPMLIYGKRRTLIGGESILRLHTSAGQTLVFGPYRLPTREMINQFAMTESPAEYPGLFDWLERCGQCELVDGL